MKKINHSMFITSVLIAGFFIGIVKGQEIRSQWINKMKDRHDNRKLKAMKKTREVTLDDYEISSFHKN